jgi:hypothetical protein
MNVVPSSKLAKALSMAQAEMKSVKKESLNPYFKAKYADLAAVCDHVYPTLSKHGLSISQPPILMDGRIYIKTVLMHESGEFIESLWPINEGKQQEMGSATSYARRYSLMAIVGLAATGEDDDGNLEAKEQDAKSAKLQIVAKLAKDLMVPQDAIIEFMSANFKKSSPTQLTIIELNSLGEYVKNYKPKTKGE